MTDITKLAHLKPGKYAILYRDNWDGEENEYHMMAVLTEDGDWYDNEFNAELLKYQGDEILKVWPLDDSSNVVALEKAQQRIAELESRTVTLDRGDLFADAGLVIKKLINEIEPGDRTAGIKVEGE
ncbi:hypothetical protein [Raoultella ornithinolytica]|jgi:hypothetical protein|uniref:Uncharacterized protein n=1 Tax=Raoultella ornithinolytica TaxID=54291 RepID=A0A9Q9JEY3_RAOOR|nr:hypothetical protein [Raoultella ornithinolytica]MEB8021703.1 hypothetical protein [Raoultella ornithinolytica]UXE39588.1 hypothetical protein N2J37_07575 [Raoultella ornithinolytica]